MESPSPGDANLPDNCIFVDSRQAWRSWLTAHAQSSTGVWVATNKKGTGLSRPEYDDIVEEALCFGWIDSKPRKLDATRSMLWCAPRKAGSGWSKLNKDRVERLIQQGLMTPLGMHKVEQSQADGSWSSLDEIEALTIPVDLELELKKYAMAREYFEAFPRFTKRAILEWIAAAKRPGTRQARIEQTAKLASVNERANQWSRKP